MQAIDIQENLLLLNKELPLHFFQKIVGFLDPWYGNRKFPVDMAGFAVSVDFMLRRQSAGHNISMAYWQGHEEDSFLKVRLKKIA